MILEYNYDKANKVLELFKESKLATLNIQPKEHEGEPTFIMEYTLIDDYAEKKQHDMRRVLMQSLPERLRVAQLLNDFIEHQALKNVKEFTLQFNIVDVHKCEVTYSASFGDEANDISDVKQLQNLLEQYDLLITKMGVGDITVPNVLRREGGGKNRKYVPLTVRDIEKALRSAIMER